MRREVYEEAGVVVDQVGYHSSQPWPYPSSLMMGCWGIVKEGSDIRIDLDNELEGTSKSYLSDDLRSFLSILVDARFFTRQQVLDVIRSSEPTSFTRDDIKRIEGTAKSDQTEKERKAVQERGAFRMPPALVLSLSYLSSAC